MNDQEARSAATASELQRLIPRPTITRYCKPCLGPRNLRPLPGQETISSRGVVHYGMSDGTTLCGKDATDDSWWWPV